MKPINVIRIADYFPLQVASPSPESAMRFFGLSERPRDLGPADDMKYGKGMRVYGYTAKQAKNVGKKP